MSVMTNIFDILYHDFGLTTMAEECNRGASNFWLKGVWRKRCSSAQPWDASLQFCYDLGKWDCVQHGRIRSCQEQEKSEKKKHFFAVKLSNRQPGRFRQKAAGVAQAQSYVIGPPAGTHEMMKGLAGGSERCFFQSRHEPYYRGCRYAPLEIVFQDSKSNSIC